VWWGVAASYAAALFVVSVMPIAAGPSVPYLDKVVHLGEYLLLAWLLVQAMRAPGGQGGRVLVWAWLYAASYGALMELIQAMIPWRSAELMDAVANAIGAACGVWLGKRLAVMRH